MALQALYIKHLVTLSFLTEGDVACSRDLGHDDKYLEHIVCYMLKSHGLAHLDFLLCFHCFRLRQKIQITYIF